MDTFGLPAPQPMTMNDVHEQLAAHTNTILGIHNDVTDTIRGHINDMAAKVGKVDQRITASLNGRIRRANTLLRPINQHITGSIREALGAAQGLVQRSIIDPELQGIASEAGPMPPVAATPMPPAPRPLPPVQIYPPPPPGENQEWIVYANGPACTELVAVPVKSLRADPGWLPPTGWLCVGGAFNDPAGMLAELRSTPNRFTRACQSGDASQCPPIGPSHVMA